MKLATKKGYAKAKKPGKSKKYNNKTYKKVHASYFGMNKMMKEDMGKM